MKSPAQTRRDFIRTSALAAGSVPFIGAMSSSVRAAEGERKLNFCVAGLGSLATGQIATALQKTKYCRLAGVVSGHPQKAQNWKNRYNLPDKNLYDYDTMEKLADNPDIDVVYVVTPNALHAEHTIKALKAGKHVFCEKPMEVSVAKCQEMVDAAKAANRMLGVAYRCQYDPNHLECFRLGREKVYGAIKSLDAGFGRTMNNTTEWRLQKAMAGGGPLMDVGIYALQSTRCATGLEPIQVTAKEAQVTDPAKFKEVEEGIDWQLTFPGGIVASCQTSYNNTQLNEFHVTAEKGSWGLKPAYGYTGCHGTIADTSGNTKEIPRVANFDQFAAEMDDFAQCIMNDKPSKVSGEEGLRDVRIMMAIYEAAKTGKPVKLG
jgi:predicted dehydrogenase